MHHTCNWHEWRWNKALSVAQSTVSMPAVKNRRAQCLVYAYPRSSFLHHTLEFIMLHCGGYEGQVAVLLSSYQQA